jgi:hypothetical protein
VAELAACGGHDRGGRVRIGQVGVEVVDPRLRAQGWTSSWAEEPCRKTDAPSSSSRLATACPIPAGG